MVCRRENRRVARRGLMIVAFAVFGTISTIFAQEPTKPLTASAEQVAKADISFKVISVERGYGYDIFVDGRKLIHQPHVPGMAGAEGFKTMEDSRKVAELVVRKLKNKEMPPTITEEELRQLKVIE